VEYWGVFVPAFVAATLLPLASELPLALVVRQTGEIFWPVAVATLSNYLGACTTYLIARAACSLPSNGREPRRGGSHSHAVGVRRNLRHERSITAHAPHSSTANMLKGLPLCGGPLS
jgi:membrane protein YqaA with SNARE-associated domain